MLSVKSAAATLGISASKLYALVEEHAIPHFRIGGKILFDSEDVNAWKQNCRVGTAKINPTPTAFTQLKAQRLVDAWRKQGVL